MPTGSDSRVLAARLALARAAARGRREWHEPGRREAARATAKALGAHGPGVDRLARKHLVATSVRDRWILAPEVNRRLPARGLEHLRAALATGRGVIVTHCHWGPFPGIMGTVAAYSPGAHLVVGSWMFETAPNPVLERRRAAWLSMYEQESATLIPAPGSYRRIAGLLGDGAVVATTFDMPGREETRFLGKPVMLASGTARLAAETGALVVPAYRVLRRYLPMTVFEPAIDAGLYRDWRALHGVLAAHHSARICTDRAALEDPRRGGAWHTGAECEAWRLPNS
jgi:hypothetical protein